MTSVSWLSPCWDWMSRRRRVSTNNDEQSDVVRRWWTKCRSRWRTTEMDRQVTVPASSAGSVLRAPALRGMPRHQEVRSDQTTTGADQTLDERRGDPERRVRHHFEGTARETEIGRVGANDRHVALIELIPQVRGALWMQLNGNNARTGRERARELSLQFPHRRREQGHRERRQRLRRRGAPNDYRVDATPTVARGSRTRWTITMSNSWVRP